MGSKSRSQTNAALASRRSVYAGRNGVELRMLRSSEAASVATPTDAAASPVTSKTEGSTTRSAADRQVIELRRITLEHRPERRSEFPHVGDCRRRAQRQVVPSRTMADLEFDAVIEAGPGGGALVVLPASAADVFGTKARVPVTATFDGIAYRGSTMPMGDGTSCLGIRKSIRTAAKLGIADPVHVVIERDTAERTVEVPADVPQRSNEPDSPHASRRWRTATPPRARSVDRSKQSERHAGATHREAVAAVRDA